MKSTIPTADLLRVLHKSSSAIAKFPTDAVLGCLRIEVNGGTLYSRGYGEAGSITSKTKCESTDNEVFCIQAPRIIGFVSYLQSPQTVINLEGDNLSIKSGNREARFKTLPATDFPPVETFEPKSKLLIDWGVLWDGMKACAGQAWKNADRPNLNTITLACKDGLILATSSNGRAGAIVTLAIADDSTEPFEALVPLDALDRFGKGDAESVSIEVGESALCLTTDSDRIFVRLSAQPIPNIKVVFDQNLGDPPKATFTVSREDFLSTMRAAVRLRGDSLRAAGVRMDANKLGIALSGKYGDAGDLYDEFLVKVKGEGFTFVDATLLTAWLSALKDDVIKIEIRDEFSPVRVLPEAGESHDYILMPLRG